MVNVFLEKPKASLFLNKLAIVTVNYNLKHDTSDCLHSLLSSGAVLTQIVVVDNGSQDDSEEFLKNQFGEELTILVNSENLGYAHGLNRGITYVVKEHKPDWVLLINNDTLVAEDFLTEFSKVADLEAISLLGPVIYYQSQPSKVWGFGDRIIPGTLIGYGLYKDKSLPSNVQKPVSVDILNGCCMLIHQSVFDKVGLFDTTFFMYGEEVDFCWRARRAGFQMAGVPRAKMWHKVSTSANRMREKSLYLRIRNQIHFYRRYANGVEIVIMFLFSFFRNLIVAIKYLLSGAPRLFKAVVNGWKDGWSAKISSFRL